MLCVKKWKEYSPQLISSIENNEIAETVKEKKGFLQDVNGKKTDGRYEIEPPYQY